MLCCRMMNSFAGDQQAKSASRLLHSVIIMRTARRRRTRTAVVRRLRHSVYPGWRSSYMSRCSVICSA